MKNPAATVLMTTAIGLGLSGEMGIFPAGKLKPSIIFRAVSHIPDSSLLLFLLRAVAELCPWSPVKFKVELALQLF